jgi:predicted nucleic acid-binding protein
MIFCDTSYLVRIYLEDPGWEEVRALCASDDVATGGHAAAEIPAALHRAFREGHLSHAHFSELIAQFQVDSEENAYAWQPLTPELLCGMRRDFLLLPATCFLRAADVLHLAGCRTCKSPA